MVLMWSLVLFVILTGLLYMLGVNVWIGSKAVIDRVSGQNWQPPKAVHPSLAAGIRNPAALKMLYGIKVTLTVVFFLVAIPLTIKFEVKDTSRIGALGGAAGLGFFGPNWMLGRLVKRRHKHLRRGLPNALDLLVVCVESGLGLDQAMMQVSKELQNAHPEISQEFGLVNLELRHGKRRAEALRNLADRSGVEDLKKLAAVLIQADRFGTSIAQSLRNHSDYMRTTYRQEAETRAAKIGIKLVFPIFFCILPALFVVTAGPVVVRIMRDLLPMMNNM
ncbi:MAG: type II secretion system F family protein [Acidobacteria bacterium]|nr:type II secretion system F family protein [Acidobacteriota bacterium]